ncbi:MAG TPA: SRPBCC family protein [Candidatus Competibacter sp.]|nr:hypothetical protein [Candidatus Competibacteraceae bacterium]HRC73859.1 SRPBCC family protein [Candidatus Competibacter sp.]
MAQHRITASALLSAPARQVYATIADYRDGHPRILPKPPFVSLAVERGGIGAGTVIDLQMRVLGKRRSLRGTVTEPEPGRVIVETYSGADTATRFTVEPRDGGRRAQVTIATDLPVHSGFLGTVEGWLATRLLRPVYLKELRQLEAVAATRA